MCVARYRAFVGQLTGNIVFFGLSLAPEDLRKRAGVSNIHGIYIGVIFANLLGVGGCQYLKRNTQCPGVYLAGISTVLTGVESNQDNVARRWRGSIVTLLELRFDFAQVLMLIGDLGFSLYKRSPWWALFFAPCLGALNALSSDPPLSTGTAPMTANLQKIPPYLYQCWDERKWLRPPIGAIVPLPALLGAAVSAALLWTENHRWIYEPFASVPIIVGLVITLCVQGTSARASPRDDNKNADGW